MSIRRRLTVVFLLMLGLILAIAGFIRFSGPVMIGSFRQSLDAMVHLSLVREFQSFVVSERTAINRYLLLNDEGEFFSFEEASRNANKAFEELRNAVGDKKPEWMADLEKIFLSTDRIAKRVANDYHIGQKSKAHDEWGEILTPQMKKLLDEVAQLEKEKAAEANRLFDKVRRITAKIEKLAIIVFLCVFVVGLILFRSLYRAVMSPLAKLERGTKEFGRGHWDHRIVLPQSNEFGALADAFNAMAENVKQLQMQTVHMDRMSAVGQLAGGVAHEINNPLTAVLGQTQILLAKLPETDPMTGSLKKIENAALRCRKIVRGLLDFSRPTQSTFEPTDMNVILDSTLDLCEADLRKSRVNIEKKFMPSLPKIQANVSELQQVLLNLINNAIQAMPKGGVLTMETHVRKEPLLIHDRRKGLPPKELHGPWVEVSVHDTGVGIAPEHINKIFEPFFTTKEIGKGTGLGLAVSLGIVQKHGGDIKPESDGLGKGARFTMILPMRIDSGIPMNLRRQATA